MTPVRSLPRGRKDDVRTTMRAARQTPGVLEVFR